MPLAVRYFLTNISDWIKLKFRISLVVLPIMLTISMRCGYAQSIESTYPKTLISPSDTFKVRFSMIDGIYPFKISEKDTIDMGSDGALGLYVTIYFGNDSLIFKYQNLPYAQSHWIHFESHKGRTVYHLHFNPVIAEFSAEYIAKHNNSVQVEIPEAYELANIIWLLSPSGQRAGNLNKQGEYYQRVMKYFHPYLNHPIFKNLDFPSDDLGNYYDFRENSYCFSFKNSNLIYSGPYYYVQGKYWNNLNSLFKKLLPLVQDFSDKSNFESFYKSNSKYYANEIFLEEKRMPVKRMWKWIEDKFPGAKYNSYKVVFSPLIGGSHSTQNFFEGYGRNFKETVMFVSGPGIFDNDKSLNDEEKIGLLSGIVFTEIDHNYVNPVSLKYRKQIDSIFSNREFWTSPGGDTEFYNTPMSIFNEYMTHSVFCLYVLDNFDSATADFVIKRREGLMVDHRRYSKFKEFNQTLIKIYEENPNLDMPSLFPKILSWCKAQH
jgi:hypothetical protein